MHAGPEPHRASLSFLADGGEAGALMRGLDWSASPLGHPTSWPQSLRSVVGLVLTSQFPMFVAWGDELGYLYNDAYAPILGAKHPRAMGQPFQEVWSEIWADIIPMIEAALAGRGTYHTDLPLVLNRRGYDEEAWFTFSYSPLRDESGRVAGMFCACTETTDQVLAARRLTNERERQRKLFEQAPGFITILSGPELRFEFVNEAYTRLFGRRDFIGRTVREAFPDLEGQPFFGLLDSAFATGERFIARAIPIRLQATPDNLPTDRFLDFIYEPVRDESSVVTGLFIEGHDVTERVRAEQRRDALLRLDDRLRDVSNTADLSFTASELLGEALGVSRVGFGAFDADAMTVLIERDWHAPGYSDVAGLHRFEDYGSHGTDLKRGVPVVNADMETDPRTRGNPAGLRSLGVAAFLDVPIVEDGRTVAQMFVHSATPRAWTDEEVAFVRDFAERTRAAIARRRAEASLRESEARFRLMADAVPQIVWITDRHGRMEFLNKQFIDYTGAPAEPWSHAEVGSKFMHPDDATGVAVAFGSALDTGAPLQIEHRIRSAAGEYRWFLARAEPYRDPGTGEITRWFGASIDIHDRREVETALRASEEFNRRVLASSADCIKVLSLNGHLEFMSQGGMGVMEVDDFAEVRGACWPDFWGGEEHAKALAAVEEARRGRTARFQGFATTLKGSPRWWDVAVTPINGADGVPEKLLAVSRDVTATREAQEGLRELNETLEIRVAERTAERNLLATIVETTDTQIQALDRDYRWIAINGANAAAYEHIYGIRPRVGESVLDLLAHRPEDQAAAQALWGRALAGESFTETSEWGDEAIGRRYYEMRFESLRDGDGKLIGAFLSGRDVTDRVREQQRLAEAEEALRQAQKMEAVGQLTGGVAHDFNNLLTIIKSSTDLLRRPDLAEERRRRYVDAISDTVDRAAKLTGQLLAFARRQALKPEVFDVAERVRMLGDMLRTILGSRIQIVTEIAGGHCLAEADVAQFETALVNMAVNARDAMDGEGTLTVRVESLSTMPPIRRHAGGYGEFVMVSLSDTGSGIPADKLPQIFEPFFTTKEVGKGTGLGLSQVYGFAKQSGGDVDVVSEVGRGTTFFLYLPQVQGKATTRAGASEHIQEDTGRGRRVLVVEDNVEVGRFSTQLLQDLGYETTWAANADEALLHLERTTFDVVFSDVVMPGRSGVELGNEIRTRHPGLPVVLTSGYSHVLAEEGRHGFELLQKPYAVEDLSRVLGRVSRQPRASSSRMRP